MGQLFQLRCINPFHPVDAGEYEYSTGIKSITQGRKEKFYEGDVGYVDETTHDVIPTMGLCDTFTVDGINYSHFFISGVMGKPIGGTHAAYSLLQKCHSSCTAGDLHLLSYDVQTGAGGRRIQGLVAGCYQSHSADWAGAANRLWWRGVVVKRDVMVGAGDRSAEYRTYSLPQGGGTDHRINLIMCRLTEGMEGEVGELSSSI